MLFKVLIWAVLFDVRTVSTWAMTASMSAEQFAGIAWRMGSKYPQKSLYGA